MPAMSPRLRQAQPPVVLPHVWRVEELALAEGSTLPSGHAALDAQLPGGGWPLGAMVELLQARPEQHVWPLLLPGLAQRVRQQAGPVVLVGAPCEPFGPSLRAQGLPGERLLCVRSEGPAARLWAAEQALRCAEVAAVLAWLPRARSAELRRLQLAAQQQGQLLFVFRDPSARHEASPAPLRLWLEGSTRLAVHVLKRRGPPLEAPVSLPAQAPRLAALLAARRQRGPAPAAEPPARGAARPQLRSLDEACHALDRAVAARA